MIILIQKHIANTKQTQHNRYETMGVRQGHPNLLQVHKASSWNDLNELDIISCVDGATVCEESKHGIMIILIQKHVANTKQTQHNRHETMGFTPRHSNLLQVPEASSWNDLNEFDIISCADGRLLVKKRKHLIMVLLIFVRYFPQNHLHGGCVCSGNFLKPSIWLTTS